MSRVVCRQQKKEKGVHMAIYSCSISNVSRAKGSSAIATLAYISASKIQDERTGEVCSYGRKDRVMYTETILPESAPEEFSDPAVLFNSIENFEKADNARTAKKIIVALPREFALDKQKEVIENFIKSNLTNEGYACTYAIHTDKDNNNPHAHILIANRQINNKGEWSSKRKMEYVLDEEGQRVPQIDKETGKQKVDKNGRKQWKRINAETNPLDKKETLQQMRKQWAVECNKHLDSEKQIDHRSFADQGKEEEPTIHEGYVARKIENAGKVSDRCEMNREIKQRNHVLQQIKAELAELSRKIAWNIEVMIQGLADAIDEKPKKAVREPVRQPVVRSRHPEENVPKAAPRELTEDDWYDFLQDWDKLKNGKDKSQTLPTAYSVRNKWRDFDQIAKADKVSTLIDAMETIFCDTHPDPVVVKEKPKEEPEQVMPYGLNVDQPDIFGNFDNDDEEEEMEYHRHM